MGDFAEAMALTGLFLSIAWIIRIIMTSRRHKQIIEVQASMQTHLLDKFESPQEMARYMETDAGRRFLESATLEEGTTTYGRILGSVQVGVVLTATGIGFSVLRSRMSQEYFDGFMMIGTLATALGLGFLISSVAAFLLSRSWGLLNGRSKASREPRSSAE